MMPHLTGVAVLVFSSFLSIAKPINQIARNYVESFPDGSCFKIHFRFAALPLIGPSHDLPIKCILSVGRIADIFDGSLSAPSYLRSENVEIDFNCIDQQHQNLGSYT